MSNQVLIIGGGPAGLTAGLLAAEAGFDVSVFEASPLVGGIARTEVHNGYRYDIGGHRFFTKVSEVEALWKRILGDDLLLRPRKSRIYYRGNFYDYPLQLINTLTNLGPYESLRILLSYFKWQLHPHPVEENFEQWVVNRFGERLYRLFFRTYTEKVWGIPCTRIRADWAAQRIQGLSLSKAVLDALGGRTGAKTLVKEFFYPRLGPGMMWERCAAMIEEAGGRVHCNNPVHELSREGRRVVEARVDREGESVTIQPTHVISTMPLPALVRMLDPPDAVLQAAERLKFRDFLIVGLVIDRPAPFSDNWIYIHSGFVQVGRIQNFASWSPDMLPNDRTGSLGLEYFCHQGDGLWEASDEQLIGLATQELDELGLRLDAKVIDGVVIRQPKAYPVYDESYRDALNVVRPWLEQFENLQTIGRNGMHRYNNQDHSMLTAMLAVRNLMGERHDAWSVNVERSYHENVVNKEPCVRERQSEKHGRRADESEKSGPAVRRRLRAGG